MATAAAPGAVEPVAAAPLESHGHHGERLAGFAAGPVPGEGFPRSGGKRTVESRVSGAKQRVRQPAVQVVRGLWGSRRALESGCSHGNTWGGGSVRRVRSAELWESTLSGLPPHFRHLIDSSARPPSVLFFLSNEARRSGPGCLRPLFELASPRGEAGDPLGATSAARQPLRGCCPCPARGPTRPVLLGGPVVLGHVGWRFLGSRISGFLSQSG